MVPRRKEDQRVHGFTYLLSLLLPYIISFNIMQSSPLSLLPPPTSPSLVPPLETVVFILLSPYTTSFSFFFYKTAGRNAQSFFFGGKIRESYGTLMEKSGEKSGGECEWGPQR